MALKTLFLQGFFSSTLQIRMFSGAFAIMSDDLASDWLHHEAFRMFSDDYQECPACGIGILNQVETETRLELWCDVCDAHFIEDEA